VKRRISDIVFTTMRHDADRHADSPAVRADEIPQPAWADFDKSGCSRRKRGTTDCLRQAAWQSFQPRTLLFAAAIDHTHHPATYPQPQPGDTYSEVRTPSPTCNIEAHLR
jgi:hypothetical protein